MKLVKYVAAKFHLSNELFGTSFKRDLNYLFSKLDYFFLVKTCHFFFASFDYAPVFFLRLKLSIKIRLN